MDVTMETVNQEVMDTIDNKVPSPERLQRDPKTGRLLPGHTLTLKYGLESRQVREGLTAEARQVLNERRLEIANDLGGPSEISAAKAVLLTRFVELSAIAETLGDDLAVKGSLTAKGSRRAALNAYLQVVDRLTRVGALLGLDRVRKPVSPLDRLKQASAQRMGSSSVMSRPHGAAGSERSEAAVKGGAQDVE
jgi:hypothetical protein